MTKQQSPTEGPVAGFTKMIWRNVLLEQNCGATLAPGNSDNQLKDPTRRPPRPRALATQRCQSRSWSSFRIGRAVIVPQLEVCTAWWSVWDDDRTLPPLVQRHAHIARVLPSC